MTNEFNVTSNNQQGGITAGQVNIETPARTLNQASKTFLEGKLSEWKVASVVVTAVMGDADAFRLATQIKEFLVASGVEAKGVNQAVYAKPIQGVVLEKPNEAGVTNVIVGAR